MTRLHSLPAFCLWAALCFAPGLLAADEPPAFPPARSAVECTPRNGLPNFLAKASAGGELKVAYLGGSITAQPGYRVKTLAHLSSLYPKAKFREVNAAIGGTGSDLGAFRLQHDVLDASPDFMFVEFAVNDGGTPPADIVKAMEGIVRKTWKAFPSCDICFVYTFTDKMLEELKSGKLNRSAATMEVVADRYGIPTIHMGLEAVRLEGEGKLVMKAAGGQMERVAGEELNTSAPFAVNAEGKIVFSQDGVHPHVNTGHRLYTEAVARSLPQIVKASAAPAPHTLPAPLDAKNYENTAMLSLDKGRLSGSWTKLPSDTGLGKSYENRLGTLWKGEPGAELAFRFKGSAARIYDLLGPDCGKLEVTVDGTVSTLQRFDPYCTGHRLGNSSLARGLDESAVHDVKVRVLPDALDKEKILFEKNRPDFAKSPDKYAPTNWYAGAIFLIGELVE
ncbi:MAG: SGNH/GDSL hydrolase family protein [Verrucomicrobia bacterium]|nr:SGNH/GDSL hydrolase family protein [Verrucomicrobiota bacterium]